MITRFPRSHSSEDTTMIQKAEIRSDTPIATPDEAIRIIERSNASSAQKLFMSAIINHGQAFNYDFGQEIACILDVSEIFNHGVNVHLMRATTHELAGRLWNINASVALTAASGGNIFTSMICEELDIPNMIYAAKQPNIIQKHNGYLTTRASSYTGGHDIELAISSSLLKPTDRVLIVDDFIDTGKMTKNLLNLVHQAGAQPTALAYAINKMYAGGNSVVAELAKAENISPNHIVSFLSIQAMQEGAIWFDGMSQPFAFRQQSNAHAVESQENDWPYDPDAYLYREQ